MKIHFSHQTTVLIILRSLKRFVAFMNESCFQNLFMVSKNIIWIMILWMGNFVIESIDSTENHWWAYIWKCKLRDIICFIRCTHLVYYDDNVVGCFQLPIECLSTDKWIEARDKSVSYDSTKILPIYHDRNWKWRGARHTKNDDWKRVKRLTHQLRTTFTSM